MLLGGRQFKSGLAFVVPGLAYLITLAPDITWAYQGADGGDLITAAYTLGVPHPSGYPTYVLLGWLFSRFPVGLIAWRFNLLSAVSIAGAAWLIFNIVHTYIGAWLPALASAWTFAFIPLVWSQAIITEVYGLNILFIALLLWLSLQIRAGRTQLSFYLGLTFGLALGVHLTVILLLPVIVGALYRYWRSVLPWAVLGLLSGLLVFSYLPLRAGRGPITWETPDTWRGFWALVSGRIYRGYLFALPPGFLGPRVLALLNYFAEMGFVALVLLGLGMRWAWYHAREALAWVTASAACYLVYAIGYRTADSYVYLLPVFVMAAIGVGLGLNDLLSRFAAKSLNPLLGMVALSLSLILGLINAPRLSLRDDWLAHRFWQTMMTQAPERAVLLTYQDNHTFTLWYAQHVLKQRPDVVIIDTGLLAYDWYQQDISRTHPWLTDLSDLAGLYQQRGQYPLPLCAVLETEQVDPWLLDCLMPQTK